MSQRRWRNLSPTRHSPRIYQREPEPTECQLETAREIAEGAGFASLDKAVTAKFGTRESARGREINATSIHLGRRSASELISWLIEKRRQTRDTDGN